MQHDPLTMDIRVFKDVPDFQKVIDCITSLLKICKMELKAGGQYLAKVNMRRDIL